MKLKNDFITHETDDEQVLVSVNSTFNGIVKTNKTAAFIINCLKAETTEEIIVEKMLQTYNAPKETIQKDVHKIIEKLISIGAIE